MPSGNFANQRHTDITNHYLMMGVYGGLPLMLLWIWVIFAAFGIVGKALLLNRNTSIERQFLIWTLGSILFGHATNFFSISYFDQSVVFLNLLLASIGALPAMKPAVAPASRESDQIEQRYVNFHMRPDVGRRVGWRASARRPGPAAVSRQPLFWTPAAIRECGPHPQHGSN
jgi:hypothetical protein